MQGQACVNTCTYIVVLQLQAFQLRKSVGQELLLCKYVYIYCGVAVAGLPTLHTFGGRAAARTRPLHECSASVLKSGISEPIYVCVYVMYV